MKGDRKMKEQFLKHMEGMTKEQKIEYLEDCKWSIDMKDRWIDEDEEKYDIVNKLLKELR
jgi:hypothetical protein